MKFHVHCPWLVVVVLAGAGGLLAAEPWDVLLQNSPFAAGVPGAKAAPGAPEFRGYFVEGGEHYFSIYDPTRRRSFWLRPDETSGALRARRFDAGQQVLNVEFEGNALSLPLKRAALRVSPPPGSPPVIAAAAESTALNQAEAGSPEIKRAEQNLARARQRLEVENRRKLAVEKARQAQGVGPSRAEPGGQR